MDIRDLGILPRELEEAYERDPASVVKAILDQLLKKSYNDGYEDGKKSGIPIEKALAMAQESYQKGYDDAMKKTTKPPAKPFVDAMKQIAAESTLKPTAKPFEPK